MPVIAMWSGPRNLSTALMRAFESRTDTVVWDEPFYAHYLVETGRPHPARAESIAGEVDWRRVVSRVLAQPPGAASIHFQKHMSHHLLPHIDRSWLGAVRNAFLIREPRAMLASLLRGTPDVELADTGLPQQLEIFEAVCAAGGEPPPVIEARSLAAAPRETLQWLCARLGIPFEERMLSWPPGPRASDGPWSRHWYASVERSSGFRALPEEPVPLPEAARPLLHACQPLYAKLAGFAMEPALKSIRE